ncbi:MAG: fructose-bisphosphate aldolase [Chrysiogenetes bacterium]|nr:fructose-bisphosphate aldolase [Chrysiogenetes bacterium]
MSQTDPLRYFRRAHFSTGEIARVRTFVRENGTSMILPYDQFIEHDCRHLEAEAKGANPARPESILELGERAKFNAVAFHIGISERYWSKAEGRLPLILKINGKTSIPSDDRALSTYTSSIEDAVRLGAVGVGYTLYYGSPRQDEDLPQLAQVRKACERFGLPLIIWAYPRGEAMEAKGGRDTSYALESAARLAMEMGATIVKSNLPSSPKADFVSNEKIPSYYRELEADHLSKLSPAEQKTERARRVVQATQGIPVLFSGGGGKTDADVIENARACAQGGCFGFIIGRNSWKRPMDEALKLVDQVRNVLDEAQ